MSQDEKQTKHPIAGKHIIIAGAGIAGLAFARALDRSWPESLPRPKVTIYEKRGQDSVTTSRKGYSIGIRSDSSSGGMQALQRLGLLDQALATSITGVHGKPLAARFWDNNWKPFFRGNRPGPPPDGLPVHDMRVTRWNLIRVLYDGLPSNTQIYWQKSCTGAEALPHDRMRVMLSDGSSDECDLLIAADGAHSKIREALRPHDTLQFAGPIVIMGTSDLPDGVPPVMRDVFGLIIGGDGHSSFVSPLGDHAALWSVSFMSERPRERQPDSTDDLQRKRQLLEEARTHAKVFKDPFGQLLDSTDESTLSLYNAMDKKPISHSEMGEKSVIFMGDSNHPLTPFGGQGGNMAFADALNLADELCKPDLRDIQDARIAFDAKCIPRSTKTLKASHFNIGAAHSTGLKCFFWKSVFRFISFLLSLKRSTR